ncbi:MAG TPA: RNA polymerase sigma factor [Candidatus Limnocylindrales bacterium]|nr:RNA polymerase sigma factor [Candidatus Limnocylindrales bacterium]
MRDQLIERAKAGDREAFGQLAAGEVDRLHAIARLILRDPELARDATQEALIRCWRQLPQLRDVARFDGWLNRILVNAATDESRRNRRYEASVRSLGVATVVPDAAQGVADREQLERGFRRLKLEQRIVIVLHHYAGLTLDEVAAAIAVPPGTARTRYYQAISNLRAALDADARSVLPEEAPA